jgi:inhibitor of KinA
MNDTQIRYFSLGESALTVEFANEISGELNDRVLALSRYLEAEPFPGFIETVPAYSSLTVFFDVCRVRSCFPEFDTAFEAVRTITANAVKNAGSMAKAEPRVLEVPVVFGKDSGPDLEDVARLHKLTTEEVVGIFTSATYRVFMLGFLPGFAYMGEVDKRIATPRRQTPRTKVARGSVGIAGRQTGIYPFESPGGWQIIGRTAVELFTPGDDTPCYFNAGDRVKFYPVEKVNFRVL